MLKLNHADIETEYAEQNSNTTLVKVKLPLDIFKTSSFNDSNTTLVKVKSIPCLSFAIIMQNSNTTLVKVKS